MHKKGITEEVAKKRSRRTVKHQRGIVGADLAAIAAKRNQTTAVRSQQRLAAITKAKTEKKDKEVKKAKVRSCVVLGSLIDLIIGGSASTCDGCTDRSEGIETADERREGRSVDVVLNEFMLIHALPIKSMCCFCQTSMCVSHVHWQPGHRYTK